MARRAGSRVKRLNEFREKQIMSKLLQEAVAELKEKFRALIEQNAEIGEVDEWGKRKLAYLIDDEAEGFYVLYNFVSGPAFPAELERVSGITDGVLRSMVVRKNEE